MYSSGYIGSTWAKIKFAYNFQYRLQKNTKFCQTSLSSFGDETLGQDKGHNFPIKLHSFQEKSK
jgi:hypothetical protein